ncbi:MAG: transporter [Syntrophales bacterium]
MRKKIISGWRLLFLLFLLAGAIPNAHAFTTDDTDTLGKGKTSIAINSQVSFDKNIQPDAGGNPDHAKQREVELNASISYGISNPVDLTLTLPYQWNESQTDRQTLSNVNGFSDITLDLKWRFFKQDGLSFAFHPEIIFPAGDKDKDLGAGRVSGSLFFIVTKEIDPWEFNFNLAYTRNENELDQREDIWHVLVAAELKVMKDLRLVANAGIERNSDKTSEIDPAFILGGVIYSVTENINIELGLKAALTSTEPDYAFMGGINFSF